MASTSPSSRKNWHEGCKLVFGEVIAIIDKDALIRQSKNGLRIGNEHIGQLRRPWLSAAAAMMPLWMFLLSDTMATSTRMPSSTPTVLLKTSMRSLSGRICLATVDVPDGDGSRLVARRADAAGIEQQPAGERQRKNDADHPSHTHNPHSYRCMQQIGKRSSLTAYYASKTLSAHRLAEPKYSI